MAFATGIVLAVLTGITGRLAGFDRDRAFYPTLVIVVASYYVLFAAMTGSTDTVIIESIVLIGFVCVAIIGFRSSLWLIAAALAAHGAFDLVHHRLVSNPGVPGWWPAFCLAFDVPLAGVLAWILHAGKLPARAARTP